MARPVSDDAELDARVDELSRHTTRRLVAYIAALLERGSPRAVPLQTSAGPVASAGSPSPRKTHADRIMLAVAELSLVNGKDVFSRENIRDQIGLSQAEWMSGYTAVFQGMRADHPGGAPSVPRRYEGVFRRVAHGRHTLTDHGRQVAVEVLKEDSAYRTAT